LDEACLIMHAVPFSSFDPSASLPVAEVSKHTNPFVPMGSVGSQNPLVNFDGVLITSNADRTAPTQRAYMQVYRTGRLETVASSIWRGAARRLSSIWIESMVLPALVRSLKGLQALGVEPPYAVMMSLIGVKGAQMTVGRKETWFEDDEISVLSEDQYHFAEVILESVPNSNQECGKMLRPFIEQLANTAGRPTSSSFDGDGEYINLF